MKAVGVLVGLRVVVFDVESARRVYSQGYYGKPLGIAKPSSTNFNAPLELSLLEATYLVEKGVLDVVDSEGRVLTVNELIDIGSNMVDKFELLYRVYKELREKGLIVRSGLKYGTEFVLYEKGPGKEHAPYIVHVVGFRERIKPLEIVRAGRVSHSVRKKFVLAAVDETTGSTTYIMFKWTKP